MKFGASTARRIQLTRHCVSVINVILVSVVTSYALDEKVPHVRTVFVNVALTVGEVECVSDLAARVRMKKIVPDMVLATVLHMSVIVIRDMLALDVKTSLVQVRQKKLFS